MKLLFDENLSPKLPGLLATLFPAFGLLLAAAGIAGIAWSFIRGQRA